MAFTNPRGRTQTSLAEINIVPLVDVVLVLLIIFMLTAPIIQSGIEVNVPKTKTVKELKGGKDKLNSDLLENTLQNWAHLLDAAAKNRAAKETLEAAAALGGAVEADSETVRQMARSAGARKSTVWFMDGGKERHFLVEDPYLLTALNGLSYAGMNSPIMKAMGSFKHALTVGVTASPFFKVRNLIRDSIQSVGTSQLGYNVGQNIKTGWKLTDPKSVRRAPISRPRARLPDPGGRAAPRRSARSCRGMRPPGSDRNACRAGCARNRTHPRASRPSCRGAPR